MILAIIQARVSSTRLPQKVLQPIIGIPMLLLEIERIKKTKFIDKLLVATSTHETDGKLEKLCRDKAISCYRGSLDDVLDRYYKAANSCSPDHVVRITGDCPLIDPSIIDEVITFHLDNNYDYSGNAVKPTFPDGLDTEIVRFSCLKEAWEESILPSEREHVTPFFYNRPERFRIGSYTNDIDLSSLRWTVDEKLDFELVEKIYGALYSKSKMFLTKDILNYLEKYPDLKTYNTKYARNEGYQKSLNLDKDIVENESDS